MIHDWEGEEDEIIINLMFSKYYCIVYFFIYESWKPSEISIIIAISSGRTEAQRDLDLLTRPLRN